VRETGAASVCWSWRRVRACTRLQLPRACAHKCMRMSAHETWCVVLAWLVGKVRPDAGCGVCVCSARAHLHAQVRQASWALHVWIRWHDRIKMLSAQVQAVWFRGQGVCLRARARNPHAQTAHTLTTTSHRWRWARRIRRWAPISRRSRECLRAAMSPSRLFVPFLSGARVKKRRGEREHDSERGICVTLLRVMD
jgi:hypothetical protein